MASQEKWINLFDKAVGRMPNSLEIEEGRKAGFELTEIQRIAAMGLELPQGPIVADNTVFDVAEEVFDDEPLDNGADLVQSTVTPVSQPIASEQTSDQSSGEDKEAQAIWIRAFITYVGRQPQPNEFMIGKASGFDVSTIHQFISSGQPAKPAKPVMPKWKKALISFGVLVLVAGIAGIAYGFHYYSRSEVISRYEVAAKRDFKESLEYQVWSDTQKTIKSSELKYADVKALKPFSSSQLEEGHMKQVGRKFLLFPNWKVVIDPVDVDLTVNTAKLNVTVNGVAYATTDGNNYTATLKHLYPGQYNFVASGKVDEQEVTVSSDENITSNTEVNLSVEYLSFTVKSNLKDGDLYIGSTKIGSLSSGKLDVSKAAVAGSSAVYVKKSFDNGTSIKSKTTSIKNISEGATITLDADGVLDRDTADDLITAAYSKFSSYAYNDNTTPDGLTDIFLDGTDDSMYKDVTANIDTNTTGAKNRSADSVTFSDVDVTEVVQTGEKTFKVNFTVVYDFYYGYDSKFKTSGHIKQKLSWSANVEYVGSESSSSSSSSSSYSTYRDYRINGKAGESQVVSEENTVK